MADTRKPVVINRISAPPTTGNRVGHGRSSSFANVKKGAKP